MSNDRTVSLELGEDGFSIHFKRKGNALWFALHDGRQFLGKAHRLSREDYVNLMLWRGFSRDGIVITHHSREFFSVSLGDGPQIGGGRMRALSDVMRQAWGEDFPYGWLK